jgi:hypothetical protein
MIGNFFQSMGSMRFSGLYRRMCRGAQDLNIPGPPSYFSKRRYGIPVPTLSLIMKGYRNLISMDIPSKTLENSYLIMNRQTWTNEKQYLSMADGMEEPNGSLCTLCGRPENTMHLMFKCEQYSEPLWKLLELAVNTTLNRTLAREQQIPNRIEMHAYLVMYNIWMGAQCGRANAIMALIQEIKGNIVYRRYTRETTNRAIHCNRARLQVHLLITVKKLESLRNYQGKNRTFYTEMW